MKILISSTQVQEKKWAKGDRSGVIRTQQATAECPKFRQSIKLDLGSSEAYPAGEYQCDLEDSINVNQFGDLKLGRLVLTPSKVAAAPPVARAS